MAWDIMEGIRILATGLSETGARDYLKTSNDSTIYATNNLSELIESHDGPITVGRVRHVDQD